MYVTVEGLHFSAAHRLMTHKGKCRFLHGHNYQTRATFYGDEPDGETGMLADFAVIKEVVKQAVDSLDHLTILNIEDKDYISFLRKKGDRVFVLGNDPTCEEIAKFLFRKINEIAAEKNLDTVILSELRVWETPKFYTTINLSDIKDED